jgi:hypothetical protein
VSGSSACRTSGVSQSGRASCEESQAGQVLKRFCGTFRITSSVSNQNNKSRLTLLALREELLEESFDDARQSLKSVVDDEKKYEVVLKSLILQVCVPPEWRTRPAAL